MDTLQNAAIALLPSPTTLEGSSLVVAAVLTTLSLIYLRSANGGEEGPSRAVGNVLATVVSRRWKDGEAAGTEFTESMLVDLLANTCLNDGADGEVAVGLNL